MTTDTLTYYGSLTATTCWCGIRCAIPAELYTAAKSDSKKAVYCPLGHTFVFRESDADVLRQKLDVAERRARNAAERADTLERRLSASKGQMTKLKNRAKAGVCPCCNRSFVQMARHIATKHPDFTPDAQEGPTIG